MHNAYILLCEMRFLTSNLTFVMMDDRLMYTVTKSKITSQYGLGQQQTYCGVAVNNNLNGNFQEFWDLVFIVVFSRYNAYHKILCWL